MKREQNLSFDFGVAAAPTPTPVAPAEMVTPPSPAPAGAPRAGGRSARAAAGEAVAPSLAPSVPSAPPAPLSGPAAPVSGPTPQGDGPVRAGDTAAQAAPASAAAEPPRALSVAELGRVLRGALDDAFATPVWVEGEVSGARAVASGHLYFCLKDEKEDAVVDVAMYRSSVTPRARALVKDGARVRLRGRPAFWVPRGRLQFIADRAEAVGRGALLEALERLKAQLAAEGLFAPARKRPLPPEPRRIGVVTSRSGAVIHDICKVAFRRGDARVLLAPALVQGAGAASSMVAALASLQKVTDVDVIILGRGGGSADELGVFNDEALVRAVAGCRVPVVSAVGHEVDVTLVDFAADARAATPSQAAELIVADGRARRAELRQLRARLRRAMGSHLNESRAGLARLERKLGDPRLALLAHQSELDELTGRLAASSRRAHEGRRADLGRLEQRLAHVHPRVVLQRTRSAFAQAEGRIVAAVRVQRERRRAALGGLAGRLEAMSPLKVLSRGYSIATRDDGRAVRSAADVAPGDALHVRIHEGRVHARVTAVEPEPPAEPSAEPPAEPSAAGTDRRGEPRP